MPSLRQLLARHPSLLVVDTCAPRVEAALWLADANDPLSPVASVAVEGEASSALPVAVSRTLAHPAVADRKIADLDAIAFCDGPGSVLGIRLAAASMRAWRAIKPGLALYSYHSLPLLAVAHPGLNIVADARRDTWHAARAAAPRELVRVPSTELAALGPLGTPDNFRRWSALPVGVEPRALPWSASALISVAPDEPFFNNAPEPDAFMHEQPSYVAWTPRVHQSPAAPRDSASASSATPPAR